MLKMIFHFRRVDRFKLIETMFAIDFKDFHINIVIIYFERSSKLCIRRHDVDEIKFFETMM